MSETVMLTSNPYREQDGERRRGTVGFAAARRGRARARRRAAQPCPAGEIGGIEVKGPNVFAGYWRMPEKTQEEFTADGWFKTGDVGKIDERGYVTIVGRSKDLIITGGYNVYPAEIEGLINEMPGVAESAVIGVPHPDFGEGGGRGGGAQARRGARRRGHRRHAEEPHRQLQGAQAGVRRRASCRATRWARCRRTCCASSTRACLAADLQRGLRALRRRIPLRRQRPRAVRLHRRAVEPRLARLAAAAPHRLPVPGLPARARRSRGATP